jgi:hypothetical protein
VASAICGRRCCTTKIRVELQRYWKDFVSILIQALGGFRIPVSDQDKKQHVDSLSIFARNCFSSVGRGFVAKFEEATLISGGRML